MLNTQQPMEKAMREVRDWLEKIGVNGLNININYDARTNIALLKFKFKDKNYEFRSTSQKNCRLNMHAIARVMEFKVRSHLMGIEKFDTSMSPYLSIEGSTEQPIGENVSPQFKQDYNAYAILRVDPLASNEEIELCYKRMVKAWHPDMAGSQEAKKEFEKRFKELNEAYDKIKRERGLK